MERQQSPEVSVVIQIDPRLRCRVISSWRKVGKKRQSRTQTHPPRYRRRDRFISLRLPLPTCMLLFAPVCVPATSDLSAEPFARRAGEGREHQVAKHAPVNCSSNVVHVLH